MTTRLKNLHLTSVDLVKAGANQEADICLFKSAPDEAGEPSEEETGIIKQFIAWLHKSAAERENEPKEDEKHESFDEVREEREDKEANYILGIYLGALEDSILSIERDDELDGDRKKELILESLDEFTEAMVELVPDLAEIKPEEDKMAKSDEVVKFNPNHDNRGRFSSGGGGSATGAGSLPSAQKKAIDLARDYSKENGGKYAFCMTNGSRYVAASSEEDKKYGEKRGFTATHVIRGDKVRTLKDGKITESGWESVDDVIKTSDIEEIEEVTN